MARDILPCGKHDFLSFFKVFYPESLLCVRDPFHGLFWGRISAKVGSWHWPSPSPRESARNLLYIVPKLLITPNFLLISSNLIQDTSLEKEKCSFYRTQVYLGSDLWVASVSYKLPDQTKFGTNANGAIWWPNLQLIQVVPSGGQICN